MEPCREGARERTQGWEWMVAEPEAERRTCIDTWSPQPGSSRLFAAHHPVVRGLSPRQLINFVSRPPDLGGPPPRRAVLSMSGLSHGVIRVDAEEKLSVLTVQDVGQVMPGGEGTVGS